MQINQWIPAAHRGDAIGDSARRVRQLLRSMGHGSEIYALTIDNDMRGEVLPFEDDRARDGDITVFHFAIPSPMTAAFGSLSRGRVLQYHNVTPARFFAPYDPGVFRLAALGRREVATLAASTDLALGDSEFNRRELEAMGFARTAVMPIAVDTARVTSPPAHPALERILCDGLTNFLFVGRIVPNKRIEDIILLAEHFKRYTDARYRFIVVGRTDGIPRYYAAVRALIGRFEMLPERFLFPGVVSDWELATYYRTASVYISMSEHEGFCVPLLEAMHLGCPIVAYAATAVPETLDGAGLLFGEKDHPVIAEAIHHLVTTPALREAIVRGQRERVRAFSPEAVAARFKTALAEVLA